MKTLLIIPAYNEQDNIVNVVNEVKQVLNFCDYIIINDCSKDHTGKILDENHYNHIDLPINLGLSGAVQMGYKYACNNNYDCALQFDGDGQHKVEYIKEMIKEIEKGNDIVIGSRFVEKKKSLSLRMLGSRIITFLIKLTTGKTITDPTSGMRMLNKKMLYDYAFNMNRKPEPDTLAYQIRNGAKVKEIQVDMNERIAGSSIYHGLASSVQYMINICISLLFFNY